MTQMHPDTIRLSQEARNRLIRLKMHTGIQTWAALCRWALAVGLQDPSPPLVRHVVTDSNVEIAWKTFTGAYGPVWEALLRQRCVADGRDVTAENVAYTLTVYLHRGIGYLHGSQIRRIDDLIGRALDCAPAPAVEET